MVPSMIHFLRRALLFALVCGGLLATAFLCVASSSDDRGLLHGVAPFAGLTILGGLAYTIRVRTWDRWLAFALTVGAAISFVVFYLRVGWS